ncbi:F-box/WD repeat-containing protein 12-like [Acomys russatus]|uniref:F-box/WD repeat-containing protein 12-like n=1 Tax=Acomys russatus TaxID=60746 RepID=UPI0021E277A8|nr:F-box/WD repeat-containing protein 12-like [Acomys russatus]
MEPQLGCQELLYVFSFLEIRDLLSAAQVNKVWNEVSMTNDLWRKLSLRRWPHYKAFPVIVGTQTWKQYYFCRSELESRMESGRPEDFICKAMSGHTGKINQLAYVSPHEYGFDARTRSVVCTVSSDCTVRAWELHEGTEIWCSPVQPAPLVNLVAFPQLQLVVTVDKQGLIMGWKAETGAQVASFSLPTYCSSMEACDHPEGPFLLAACAEGNLYTLTVPQLQVVSKVTTFPQTFVNLTCSPDRQWVFVSMSKSESESESMYAQHPDQGPKVFYTQSLLHPSEDGPPVSTTLPLKLSSRVCWAPDEAARLIVVHQDDGQHHCPLITTFELMADKSKDRVRILAQQLASFPLRTMVPPKLMQGHGSQLILLTFNSGQLLLLTIHGMQLMQFEDHRSSITSMWVDLNWVITSASDLSLRVYVWNKKNTSPVLKSCYHLLGGSHRWASGFTHVKSDSVSITAVEARHTGTSILRSYCYKVQLS